MQIRRAREVEVRNANPVSHKAPARRLKRKSDPPPLKAPAITSAEWNRKIVASSLDCIKVLDLEGRLIFMNEEGKRLLAITNYPELLGKRWTDFWEGEDNAKARSAYRDARRGMEGRFSGCRPTMTGLTKWWDVIVSPIFDVSGRIEQLLVVSRDITAQRIAEADAAHQRKLLEAMNEAIPDAVLIVKADGSMGYFNQRFIAMWEFPPSVLASRSDQRALAWAATRVVEPDKFLRNVAHAYQTPTVAVREELAFKNGRVYDRYGAPVLDKAGKSHGWVWCFRDVTAERHNQTALREAKEQLAHHAESLAATVAERTSELTTVNEELQALAAKLVGVHDAERRRIANELHDEIGQQLTALKMLIEREGGDRAGLHRQSVQIVADLIRRTRELSFGLWDSVPEHLTLCSALRWHVRAFKRQTAISARFIADRSLSELAMRSELKANLFRIAQEGLTNVARHAKAKNAFVRLRSIDGHLTLTVEDNGQGFPSGATGSSRTIGLRGIRDRAIAIGAKLEVITLPGKGVTLRVSLPLHKV